MSHEKKEHKELEDLELVEHVHVVGVGFERVVLLGDFLVEGVQGHYRGDYRHDLAGVEEKHDDHDYQIGDVVLGVAFEVDLAYSA